MYRRQDTAARAWRPWPPVRPLSPRATRRQRRVSQSPRQERCWPRSACPEDSPGDHCRVRWSPRSASCSWPCEWSPILWSRCSGGLSAPDGNQYPHLAFQQRTSRRSAPGTASGSCASPSPSQGRRWALCAGQPQASRRSLRSPHSAGTCRPYRPNCTCWSAGRSRRAASSWTCGFVWLRVHAIPWPCARSPVPAKC